MFILRTRCVALMAIFLSSCSILQQQNKNTSSSITPARNTESNHAEDAQNTLPISNESKIHTDIPGVSKKECLTIKAGDDVVMDSQTFPFDSEPFAGSCFVTTYNPEYDDPPMESHYAIYKNNKKIFDFPDQFNGATFGCWVDGVSFQDLNNDKLNEVVIVGKCSTKGDSYNENMVYINTGKAFITRPDGNTRLSDFKKIKEITDFVQDNPQIFFK